MTVNDMICKMIAQAGGNKHDIAHFLKVYTYARLIGEKEQLDARTQETLEITLLPKLMSGELDVSDLDL